MTAKKTKKLLVLALRTSEWKPKRSRVFAVLPHPYHTLA
jgi:hypothetical protein